MGKPTLAQVMNLAATAANEEAAASFQNHGGKPVHGDRFRRQGRAWFCNTGLPSDITVEVDGMAFHLHKFPLTSRSGRFAKLVADSADPTAIQSSAATPPPSSAAAGQPSPVLRLPNLPGGAAAFETIAKFCYSISVEISAANVAALRCAAEYLEMTEEYGEGNLVVVTEGFLKQAVAASWKASVTALKSCEALLPAAEELRVVRKCVDSIVVKLGCCGTDPAGGSAAEDVSPIRVNDSASLASASTPMSAADHRRSMQSPDGTLLWNGISTGARPKRAAAVAAEGGGGGGGWCEDLTVLSLPFFKKLIFAMDEKGIRAETIAAAIVHYAEKFIPGLRHHRSLRACGGDAGQKARSSSGYRVVPALTIPVAADICSAAAAAAPDQQLILLETIECLLPSPASTVSAKFLLSMLKVSLILNAASDCKSRLEQRIGHRLHLASVDDLLIPNYSYGSDTLYDVDCMQRLINHFLSSSEVAAVDQPPPPTSADFGGESITVAAEACETYGNINLTDADSTRMSPLCSVTSSGADGVAGVQLRAVAKLLDEYLAEIASDPNLEPSKFQALAQALPHCARESDDGLYRAIDIFVKNHGWMKEREREEVCSIMDCAKLTVEACAHAAQNEKMPLRVVVQVLFMEQMQLRDAIMMGGAPPPAAGVDAASKLPAAAAQEEEMGIQLDMASLRRRVAELERECHRLRRRLRCRPSRWASGISSKLSCRDVADAAAAPRHVAAPPPPPPPPPRGGRRSYSSSSSSPPPSFSNNSSPFPFTIKHTLKLSNPLS